MSKSLFFLTIFLVGVWFLYDEFSGKHRLRFFIDSFTAQAVMPDLTPKIKLW